MAGGLEGEVNAEISHLREIVELRAAFLEKALALQAAEYERRLQGLNNEHARLAQSNAEHVSRQLFDQVVGELHKADNEAQKFRDQLDGQISGIRVSYGVILAILGLAIAALAIWHPGAASRNPPAPETSEWIPLRPGF
jgi:hypothetical protein